jgi:hypothetical protein
MNLKAFMHRTAFWRRFRHAMITLWQPLVLLAMIPTIVTLGVGLPFAANLFLVAVPLIAVAAYLAGNRFGKKGLFSVVGIFLLGVTYKLWNFLFPSMKSNELTQPVSPIDPNPISHSDAVRDAAGIGHQTTSMDNQPSIVILIVMLILFGAAAYFGGRLGGGEQLKGSVAVLILVILVGFTLRGFLG